MEKEKINEKSYLAGFIGGIVISFLFMAVIVVIFALSNGGKLCS